MNTVMSRIVRGCMEFFVEPTEAQIESELRTAFGLKQNIEYSIRNNNVAVKGGDASFRVNSGGVLYSSGTDDDFKAENNKLYVKE